MTASIADELTGMRALARSLVHGDAEVDDLVHDTAAIALAKPPDTGRPVLPWLAAVMRNRLRMDRRADRRRIARELDYAREQETATADPLDRVRMLERLSTALVALDEIYRTVIVRRYLDGESAADIARALAIPAGTVRWRLSVGLERLRAALDETSNRKAWMAALVPIAKGAVAVKTKSWVVIAILVVLALLGSVAIVHKVRQPAATQSASSAATPTSRPQLQQGGATFTAPTSTAPDAGAPDEPTPLGRVIATDRDSPGGTLRGRVLNWSTAEPVAGAELTFTDDTGAATTILSRDDGGFELAPPAPGVFSLATATKPGFLPYAPEFGASPIRAALAKNRDVRGIEIFMFLALDYSGRVVDQNNAPVAGAKVILLGTPAGEQIVDKLDTEWTTDKDGTFTFHAADYAVLEAKLGTLRGRGVLNDKAQITHELVIKMDPKLAPRDQSIAGIVVADDHHPVAGALVQVQPLNNDATEMRAPAFARSDAAGKFSVDGLDAEGYHLQVNAEGFARADVDTMGGAKDVMVTLPAGGVIAGHVVSADGTMIPSFSLLAYVKSGPSRMLAVAKSFVDPSGAFSLRLPEGEYELLASAEGWAPSALVTAKTGAKDLSLELVPGAVLVGTVVDADGPVAYARVMREARGGGASVQPSNAGTVTAVDGSFELAGIPPGPLSVTIAAGAHNPKIEAGMVAKNGDRIGPITITLAKLAPGEEPTLELVGIGAKLSAGEKGLHVDGVIPGGGAEAAGILAGDYILAVEGQSVFDTGIDGAIALIRGTVGTTVAVTLLHNADTLTLQVERRKLKA